MRATWFSAAACAVLMACSPPSAPKADAPPAPTPAPAQTACNTVTPDITKAVSLRTEAVAAASLPPELLGGPVQPGTYDAISGVLSGGATEPDGALVAALQVAETENGVTFNWAQSVSGNQSRWTATFVEGPPARLAFTCGREGETNTSYGVENNQLQLRIPEGSGAATYVLVRRG